MSTQSIKNIVSSQLDSVLVRAKQKLKEVSAPSQLLLDAYTLVRNDFLINQQSFLYFFH